MPQSSVLCIELIKYAESFMSIRNFHEAFVQWAVVREKFPERPQGYSRGAWACVELSDFVQAEAICKVGIENASTFIEPYVTYAEIAMRRRDFKEALHRWSVVREKFPERPQGYSRGAWACVELSDFMQAEAICKVGIENASTFIEPYVAYAEIAMRRRNFKEALNRWSVIREKFPERPQGYSRGAWACVELSDFAQAEAICKVGIENASTFIEPYITYAEIAMRRRDFKEALHHWSVVREKFPAYPQGYSRGAWVCVELTDFVQAEAICKVGIENASTFIEPYVTYAEIAMRRRDFKEALHRWSVVREKFPAYPQGYSRGAWAYVELSDFVQAEAICKIGIENASTFIEPYVTYAEIVMRRSDFKEALSRWSVVREKFPAYPQGYSRGAWAYVEIGDFDTAEELCLVGIDQTQLASEPYITFAEISMRQKDYTEALVRWKDVRDNFPQLPYGYTRAAWARLEMDDFIDSKALCVEYRDKYPNCPDPFIISGEISMRMRNYKEALEKWSLVREKFPWHHAGYCRAAQACISLLDFSQAEIFCIEGMKKASEFVEPYISYAEISMTQKNYLGACKRWKNVCQIFPYHYVGYSKGARACIELGDYSQADSLCRKGFEMVPYAAEIFISYAEISMYMKNYEEAKLRYNNLIYKFPYHLAAHYSAINAAIKIEDFNWAQRLYDKIYKNCFYDRNFQDINLKISLDDRSINIENALENAINKIIKEKTDRKIEKSRFLFLNLIDELSKYKQSYKSIQKIFIKLLYSKKSKQVNIKPQSRKICIFINDSHALNFYAPVLKYLSATNIDIVVENKLHEDDEFIKVCELDSYNVLYGHKNLDNYEIVVCDNGMIKYTTEKHKLIILSHSQDSFFTDIRNNFYCIIYSTQAQAEAFGLRNSENIISLPNIRGQKKCEFTYTGPYHMDGFWDCKKEILRKKIEDKYNFLIPKNQKMIFILEDEYTNLGQLIYGMNAISEYASVVFKPLHRSNKFPFRKISNRILILHEKRMASNIFRFSSDIILAGYLSGSFMSSILSGQNVIAYYSRLIKRKWHLMLSYKPVPYYSVIPDKLSRMNMVLKSENPKNILIHRFYSEHKLFDILNKNSMRTAIQENLYLDWYKNNICSIQNEVFGNFLLKTSAKRTAEYILRFAKEGTLGQDCSAFYIHK